MSENVGDIPAAPRRRDGHAACRHDSLAPVLITGGATRIGRAIALDLAATGRPLALHYNRSADAADGLVGEIEAAGGRAVALGCDLERLEDVPDLIGRARAALGPLGGLVNNASRFVLDHAGDFTLADLTAHHAVNLAAPALLSQAFAHQVPDGLAGGGAIVNMLDQKLFNLNPDFFTYSLAKVGLLGMTQMTAMAFAPRVRVNGVAPGLVLPSGKMSDETFRRLHRQTPLGRGPGVDEIVAAVRFCLETSSLTGQTITVDGGESLQWRPQDIAFGSSDAAGEAGA